MTPLEYGIALYPSGNTLGDIRTTGSVLQRLSLSRRHDHMLVVENVQHIVPATAIGLYAPKPGW